MKLNKARVNFLVDALIGLAMVVEAISGFVLWLVLSSGGYRGGRGSLYPQTFILSRGDWLAVHDWFAVVMVVGILIHVALHWKWIVCMVRGLWQEAFPRKASAAAQKEDCPA